MKFIDINREFTAAANSYMAQGYYINAGTMGGSQGEVAHIDLTNGTEIIRVLLTTFNNYLGTEGVELIVGRVKDDIKPNQEDRWNTVWNERLEVISNKKFYRLNNRAQDGFYGTEEEANAAEEKRFDRYKSRRSNDQCAGCDHKGRSDGQKVHPREVRCPAREDGRHQGRQARWPLHRHLPQARCTAALRGGRKDGYDSEPKLRR